VLLIVNGESDQGTSLRRGPLLQTRHPQLADLCFAEAMLVAAATLSCGGIYPPGKILLRRAVETWHLYRSRQGLGARFVKTLPLQGTAAEVVRIRWLSCCLHLFARGKGDL